MATSMSMSKYSGYPTQTSMRVSVSFSVTYEGNYYTYFELYDDYDDLIDEAQGSTFSMSANSSKSGIYKTFSGLDPGTSYYIVGSLWNADTDVRLSITEPVVRFTTESPSTVTVKYYDGNHSWSDSSTGSVTIDGPYRTDWDFEGWATSTKTTSVSYQEGDTISAGSSDKSVSLYAVYSRTTAIYCHYIDGTSGSLASNTRYKIQYRVNTSTSVSSTNYYNNITLPNFNTANSTITTSTPNRSWTVLGWHPTSFAMEPDYSPGQSVASNLITGDLYAVYSNECSITYNSNGGSGSMTKQTGTGYYSASGEYVGATFTIKDCTFTPPSGKMFESWNQKADGSGVTYSNSILTSYNIVLYAIWVKARPSNWSWPTAKNKPISSGSDMNYLNDGVTITPTPLTAVEWLAFMDRIKEFYAYDNNKVIDDTYWYRAVNGVEKGKPMTATQVNSARYLISQLSIQTSLPSKVSSGTGITAAFINGLKNSLNSIP